MSRPREEITGARRSMLEAIYRGAKTAGEIAGVVERDAAGVGDALAKMTREGLLYLTQPGAFELTKRARKGIGVPKPRPIP